MSTHLPYPRAAKAESDSSKEETYRALAALGYGECVDIVDRSLPYLSCAVFLVVYIDLLTYSAVYLYVYLEETFHIHT